MKDGLGYNIVVGIREILWEIKTIQTMQHRLQVPTKRVPVPR